jgi:hypothetical protein
MDENLIAFAAGHNYFNNYGLVISPFTIKFLCLKHVWHLWNYNICLIINLCLIVYWYFVFLFTLTIKIIMFLLHIFEL